MQRYIWTKKRKKTRTNLVTLAILGVFIFTVNPLYSSEISYINKDHPIITVIFGILVLIGFVSIAQDITTLLIYEEE